MYLADRCFHGDWTSVGVLENEAKLNGATYVLTVNLDMIEQVSQA